MSDILLRELSNADIDWLVTTGDRTPVSRSQDFIQPGQQLDSLYLLLEGNLTLKDPSTQSEIVTLSRGDLFGEGWLFDISPVAPICVPESADKEVLVLAVPKADIQQKLKEDTSFAAHFYRALALILSEHIRHLFERSELLRYQSGQVVKEALFVFSELHDSDIDWMMNAGALEKISPDSVLLHPGRPVDALYTVLDGQLVISTTETPCDPLSTCRHGLTEQGHQQNFTPTAYLSRGGLPGIISFLDFQPLPVRIHAASESLLLAIPRQKVSIKLQSDLGFAARFYRVIATQTATLLNTVISSGKCVDCGDSMDMDMDDELDLEALQQVSEGGAKFDWMLRHLGVGCR